MFKLFRSHKYIVILMTIISTFTLGSTVYLLFQAPEVVPAIRVNDNHEESPDDMSSMEMHATTPITTNNDSQPQPQTSPIVGTFCNGWIKRVTSPKSLTIFDSTNGRAPTSTDCANAQAYYDSVAAANKKYMDISVAVANGFVKGSYKPTEYSQHYYNKKQTTDIANPENPEGLVYHFDTPDKATLIGVYFSEKGDTLTQPAGPLTIWHSHTPTSTRMFHVWLFPGNSDPFSLMRPDA